MRKLKTEGSTTLSIETTSMDSISPIIIRPTELMLNQARLLKAGVDGVSFKFRDSSGNSKVPPPAAIKVFKEGGATNYRLSLYYLPGEAPRASGRDMVNTSIYDGNSLIIQTGTDERSGKAIGKVYKNLVCTGWCYANGLNTDDDQRYEQVSCITAVVNDWDQKSLDLKTLGLTQEQLKN